MSTRPVKCLGMVSLIGLFCLPAGNAEEQPAATQQGAPGQMGGMHHGGMGGGQQGQSAMGGMGAAQQGQGGMGGMQQGGMGGGMMEGGGMMGGGMMPMMSEEQQEEALKQMQAQDIRLGELRRQIREATDQAARDKLKTEHRSVLQEQLSLMHKLMMQQHMKSMHGSSMSGGQSGQQPPAHPAKP